MAPENTHNSISYFLSSQRPGHLLFGGARMALLDIEASFWGIRRQIEALAGRHIADSVLQQAGANGGASFARSFATSTLPEEAARLFRECVAAYQAAGFGSFEITVLEWPLGRVLIKASDTFESWMMKRHAKPAGDPVCAYSSGVLVGFVNVLAGRTDVVCVERACQAAGQEACVFELVPASDVGRSEIPLVAFSPDPALGRQMNLLELLFDRMPMGIAIFDEQFKLRRCNLTWVENIEKYTSTVKEQVVPGKTIFELVRGSEADIRPLFERVLKGETLQIDALPVHSCETISYRDGVFTPIQEDGEVVGILDVTTDATDRVRQDAELLKHRSHLEELVAERTEELRSANLSLQVEVNERAQVEQALIDERKRVSERTRELSSLLEVSQSLASTIELKPLLGLILDHLKAVIQYHGASILELEGDTLVLHAYIGPIPQEQALKIRFPLSEAQLNNRVIQGKAPVIVPDVRGDEPLARAFQESAGDELTTTFGYVRSWMGVPLIVKDRVIGMVSLDHSQPAYYLPEHSQLVMAFANQVAVAIENARLYADVRQRADEAQTILAVQKAITSELDVNDVLQMIADEARRLTSTEQGAVYLLDGDELVVSVVSGDVRPEMLGYRLPVKGSIAGLAVETGQPYLISDSQKDERVYGDIIRQVGARTFVIVPLMSNAGPIGTITVANKDSRPLGAEDERILKMLSSGAVVALENARLYRDEQEQRLQAVRRRQVAEGLRDVLAVLNSNRPLDYILTFILRQSSQFLSSDAGVIYRMDRQKNLIIREASTDMPAEFDTFTTLPLLLSEPNQSILNRKPFAVPDLRSRLLDYQKKEINFPGMENWFRVMLTHFGAYISVPLLVRDEIYGALSLYYKEKREFSQEEIDLAVFLADQVALAIENARLRTQVQQSAVATERSRLARDLHDAVTQTLFSASLIAEVLPRIWERNQEEGQRRLAELRELTRGALAEMRTLLLELRPSALVEAELSELFRHLMDAFTGRARLPIDLSIEGDADLPADVKVALYRIAQEALNNVVKHAEASRVTVRIRCLPEQVELHISDDGCGFDAAILSPEHLGVGIMMERAENIGAVIHINSAVGQGTQISVIWKDVS
jgi:signal transduction histidine kinase/putative methionine-R-sulfoxide reductase with GAF domain/predicted hydrocarbon binding protein